MTSRGPVVVGGRCTGARRGESVRSMTWDGGGFRVGLPVDNVGRDGVSSGTACRLSGGDGRGCTY